MIRRSKKGIYAFIDSQNLNVGVQKYGWKMDWIKFRKFLNDKYGVTKAFMFIGYVPEFEAMYQQLHEAGYMIVLKPTYDMTRLRPVDSQQLTADSKHTDQEDKKSEEKKPVKGNVDADLVLWVMKEMPRYSKAIIVSGDGDFYSLIEYLDEQKRLLKLLAPNAQYSGLYHKYEQYVERLDKYRYDLAYRDHRRRSK